MLDFEQTFIAFITGMFEAEIDKVKEEYIQKELHGYEVALREKLGQTAIKVSDYFHVQRREEELVITCRIKKD